MATQHQIEQAHQRREAGQHLTARERRLAHKRDCQLDPGLRAREITHQAQEQERREQARQARPLIALAVQRERVTEAGPLIELVVSIPGGLALITLGVRPALMSDGAREVLQAGLRSTWNADDASTLVVRSEDGREQRVMHTSAWRPDVESPEEHLDACFSTFAGRVVRAGLGS